MRRFWFLLPLAAVLFGALVAVLFSDGDGHRGENSGESPRSGQEVSTSEGTAPTVLDPKSMGVDAPPSLATASPGPRPKASVTPTSTSVAPLAEAPVLGAPQSRSQRSGSVTPNASAAAPPSGGGFQPPPASVSSSRSAPAGPPAAAGGPAVSGFAATSSPPASLPTDPQRPPRSVPKPSPSPSPTEVEEAPQPAADTRRMSPSPDPAISARVFMVIDRSELAVGDVASVRVVLEGGTDVASVPFHVVYNSAVVEFVDGLEGTFLSGDGRQTAFFAAPTAARDRVVVGLSRLGAGGGLTGSGELCTLRFRALAPGSASLAFASQKVRDASNRIAPASFSASPLVVSGTGP